MTYVDRLPGHLVASTSIEVLSEGISARLKVSCSRFEESLRIAQHYLLDEGNQLGRSRALVCSAVLGSATPFQEKDPAGGVCGVGRVVVKIR